MLFSISNSSMYHSSVSVYQCIPWPVDSVEIRYPIISNCYHLKSTTSVQKLYTHFIHLGCIRMTMRNRTSIYNTSIERVWKNSCIHIWFLKISLFIKGPNIILLSFLFFQILIKGTWLQKSVVIFSVIIAMISWNKS